MEGLTKIEDFYEWLYCRVKNIHSINIHEFDRIVDKLKD